MIESSKRSAGLLMFRRQGRGGALEVFLAHPGGPFFRNKDDGAWTIPKGLIEGDDDPLKTAIREFAEETGIVPPTAPPSARAASRAADNASGPFISLGEIKQSGGKVVRAWAFEGDVPNDFVLRSNTFTLEWPPKSGRTQEFPEIDRAEFFDLPTARRKINPAQAAFLDRLQARLGTADEGG